MFKQKNALHERLLAETRSDLEEFQASNTRMRAAGQINKDDVKVEQLVANGAVGKVHAEWYAGHKVAVKVLTQALDPELSPRGRRGLCPGVRAPDLDPARQPADFLRRWHDGGQPAVHGDRVHGAGLAQARADRALGWGVRLRIAAQVARWVTYLLELKIVHRDLKSDNVLLNGQIDAKVADSGTSKLVIASRARLQAAAMGETSFGDSSGGGSGRNSRWRFRRR